MSKVEVNTIEPQCGTTVTVGKCTSTVAVPGNVIKSNAVQASDGGNIVSQSGTDITLGASGDTINLASGASQSGFGRTGTVDWQTGDIKTATFTAATGKGYFCNTTGGVLTVNLPAGSAGDIVGLKDYAGTWDSNAITLNPNGSDKIGGDNSQDPTVENEGGSLLLVYVDGTQGWLTTSESVTASPTGVVNFLTATVSGACNTLTTAPDCANVKLAKFVGPGTFCVSQVATCVAQNIVGYQIVAAGGGGGASCGAGGGGAGGYREGRNVPVDNFTASPLVADYPGPNSNEITVTATAYPITVGAGGAGGPGPSPTQTPGSSGSDSVFSTITSTAGGFGGAQPDAGGPGGSGGGGAHSTGPGGTGNTPTVAPAQGLSGGTSDPGPAGDDAGGGGGGALTAGNLPTNGQGGPGATTSITGSPVVYAGGGGGGFRNAPGVITPAFFPGGTGGGGDGGGSPGFPRPAANAEGDDGTVNTGGGGGGGTRANPSPAIVGEGGTGGSGIVYIRYKFQ